MNSILLDISTCFPESSTFRQGKRHIWKDGALLAAEESAREASELRVKGIY